VTHSWLIRDSFVTHSWLIRDSLVWNLKSSIFRQHSPQMCQYSPLLCQKKPLLCQKSPMSYYTKRDKSLTKLWSSRGPEEWYVDSAPMFQMHFCVKRALRNHFCVKRALWKKPLLCQKSPIKDLTKLWSSRGPEGWYVDSAPMFQMRIDESSEPVKRKLPSTAMHEIASSWQCICMCDVTY